MSVSFKPLGVEGPDLIWLLLCGEAGGDRVREEEEEEKFEWFMTPSCGYGVAFEEIRSGEGNLTEEEVAK